MNPIIRTICVIIVFSIAMAALESSVVVYLRALYYEDGFTVAFRLIDKNILLIELLREVATLVMIWGVGYLAGKNRYERFAHFLLCFATWDIFYYVWLKVFIDWPSSLFEWDILFLIPVTWLGPVLSPVICSVTMIALALVLLSQSEVRISNLSMVLLVAGSLLILFTYLYDYGNILWSNGLMSDYANLIENKKFVELASVYVPEKYNWGAFWVGELVIVGGIGLIWNNTRLRNFKHVSEQKGQASITT